MKKLNEKQKKILNIVVTSLQIAVVLLAVILSAIVLANPNVESNKVGKVGTKLLPVLTNSMAGDQKDSFRKGDLVISKTPKNPENLKVGDIVTFKAIIDGREQLNTHRIVKKDITDSGKVWFQTAGDAAPDRVDPFIYAEDVLAVYQFHLKGVGKAIFWLQKPMNFLFVIVFPLIALFIYNVIMFIRMMMQSKLEKVVEKAGVLAIDEEEIKRRAIEEYLASKPNSQGTVEQAASKAENKEQASAVKEAEPKAEEKPKTAANKPAAKTASAKPAQTKKTTAATSKTAQTKAAASKDKA